MPPREEILSGLTAITNQYSNIAIAWHIVIVIIIAALFAGWKPNNSLMILFLSSLLMSVSIFAGMEGNFFNAAIFAVMVIVSIYAALKTPDGIISGDRSWPDIAGLLLIIFGLIYPEFMNQTSLLAFAFAAPTGLIPCPTLCILIGFSLLYRGFESVMWSLTIVTAGLLYGLFGVFYLGVNLDWFLVAGSVVLILNTFLLSKTASWK